ncbi:hypothetical protein GCM10010841_15640 [Deinococcus aerophilus]|uniref:ZU5 domain-containing protein n=1 Tax=Deinococcus aerophilus TaxID=522488 RepID=A0ABQ2GRS5_9DEIO|nr:hypothetical protein GCM10010841_15640 [Deinococcus aerophilus]
MTLAATGLLALNLSGCAGTQTPPSTVITADGGTVSGPDGATVTVPAGALTRPTAIAITRVSGMAQPSGVDAAPDSPVYQIEPHDVTFKEAVTIRLPLPAGVTSATVYAAEDGTGWYPHAAVIKDGYLELQRNGFSYYYWKYTSTAGAQAPGEYKDHFIYKATQGITDTQFDPKNAQSSNYGYIEYTSTQGTWTARRGAAASVTFSAFRTQDGIQTALPACANPKVIGTHRVPGGPRALLGSFEMTSGASGSEVTVPVDTNVLALGDNELYFGLSCAVNFDAPPYAQIGIKVNATVLAPLRTVGGRVSGLGTGQSVTLSNGGRTRTVVGTGASGGDAFAFDALESGEAYDVRISASPAGSTCAVTNGSGTVGSTDVTGVAVTCAANRYAVGGSVTGLPQGQSVTVSNAGVSQSVASSGGAAAFSFAGVEFGTTYNVTVSNVPAGYTCTVTGGSGTVGAGNVTGVAVTCAANPTYAIGGTVSGLVSDRVKLQLNGGETVSVGNGSFAFTTRLEAGQTYTVALTDSGNSSCTLSGAGGTVGGAVGDITVSCTPGSYTIGGTVSGLSGGVFDTAEVQLNGGETLTLRNGAFVFQTRVTDGQPYAVTIPSQGQSTCTVQGGSGTVAGMNVSVSVSCEQPAAGGPFHVTGAVDGWMPGEDYTLSLTLSSPDAAGGSETVVVDDTTYTNFAFGTALSAGSTYTITLSKAVSSDPGAPSLTCMSQADGSNTATADMFLNVTCFPPF